MEDHTKRENGCLNSRKKKDGGEISKLLLDRSPSFPPIDICRMSSRELYSTLFPDGYISELRKSMKIAVPMTFGVFCQLIIQPLAILFGGHLGTIALGTLGLANSVCVLTQVLLHINNPNVSDHLCALQHNVPWPHLCMRHPLLSGIVAFSLVCFILYGINLNMALFLITMGQDPVISVLVGRYLIWFMPAVPTAFILKVARNYTVLYGETKSFFASGVAGVILAILFNFLFVNVLEFGLIGSAFAQNIALVVSTSVYLIYIVRLDFHRMNWAGMVEIDSSLRYAIYRHFAAWSWRLFERWGEFFGLAIAGVFMTSLEMWAFEISVFLAGLLGSVELSAQSIVFNLDMMLYALPAGLGVACAIRTGQCLGAGRPTEARSACYVSISCVFFVTVIPTTLYATLRYELPKLFTDDAEVIALAAELLPFVAFYNVFMNLSIVMRGVLRGIGKQRVGSVVITISYYVLALPIGSCLMFLTPLGTKGLISTHDTEMVDDESDSIENGSKTAEWLDEEMPRDLKIKSAFYIAIPVAFFILCIVIKLTCSYDEGAILDAMRASFGNDTANFNSTSH
ncbi:hypothetical protein CAPTEDRAFT_214524 [Capitella teleta]|uniref:Multidrug and toxin extrusion protein n=1 Tax=Capitella teleta TaxID=283909 RepID=R7VCW0_CAPTE|nr:hypothetical protein CAPTEDRAFT_214524 [Capitella teleta]|eukprot:ELU16658.1 hypothetical protein CAPTEDRAFT_214524 [Capitella teleta]